MSFTLFENKNMANTWNMYCYFEKARLDIVALCLACQTLEPEGQGRFQGGHL